MTKPIYLRLLCFGAFLGAAASEAATPAITCGGFAQSGGALLTCSQSDPTGPTQLCTFSWALVTEGSATQVVQGSFLMPPRAANVQVYRGSGFSRASSNPIILCRGQRSAS